MVLGTRPDAHYHYTNERFIEVAFPSCGQLYERKLSKQVTEGTYDVCYVFRVIFFLPSDSLPTLRRPQSGGSPFYAIYWYYTLYLAL